MMPETVAAGWVRSSEAVPSGTAKVIASFLGRGERETWRSWPRAGSETSAQREGVGCGESGLDRDGCEATSVRCSIRAGAVRWAPRPFVEVESQTVKRISA
jgi:hypothetical protein